MNHKYFYLLFLLTPGACRKTSEVPPENFEVHIYNARSNEKLEDSVRLYFLKDSNGLTEIQTHFMYWNGQALPVSTLPKGWEFWTISHPKYKIYPVQSRKAHPTGARIQLDPYQKIHMTLRIPEGGILGGSFNESGLSYTDSGVYDLLVEQIWNDTLYLRFQTGSGVVFHRQEKPPFTGHLIWQIP